jgi:hypothetical protein
LVPKATPYPYPRVYGYRQLVMCRSYDVVDHNNNNNNMINDNSNSNNYSCHHSPSIASNVRRGLI